MLVAMFKKTKLFFFLIVLICTPFSKIKAYPLDGFDETEVSRLDGYFHSLLTASGKENLGAGALQSITELTLSKPTISLQSIQEDRNLKESLVDLLPSGASFSLIDLSSPKRLAYVGIRDEQSFVPSSVGKIMVAISFFDALARAFPNSIKDRERVLRERIVIADEIIETDHHDVPFWNKDNRKIYFRPLVVGDSANLWTYLDFMLSASSNAAASLIMRETILLNFLGKNYVSLLDGSSRHQVDHFLSSSAANQYMARAFIQPLTRYSLGGTAPFQASFYTKSGKASFSGLGSSATTRGLVGLLFFMEQGRLIDEFSSLELKRLLYLTQHRERYVGNTLLADAAVYFKAGSMYRCGGPCEKYEGTIENRMNAAVLVEYPVAAPKIRYIVALSTNLLRYNSDRLHNEIAGKIHRLILSRSRHKLE